MCKACRVLKGILYQREVFCNIHLETSSQLDKYYYPHHRKVRVKQGTKVACQRTSEFEIRTPAFLVPMSMVRQRRSEAKILIHSYHSKRPNDYNPANSFFTFSLSLCLWLKQIVKKRNTSCLWLTRWVTAQDAGAGGPQYIYKMTKRTLATQPPAT